MSSSLNPQDQVSKPTALAITIIVACSFFLFFKYLMSVSLSIMTPELMHTFNIHGTGLGILGAAFLFAYLIFQLFCGLLLDSFSIRWTCVCAILLSTLGLVLFGWADFFWEAILGRALQGIGAAFATVSYMKLTANWFHPRYFARISGFVATAAMIGAMAGDAPLAIINQHFGWRAAVETCVAFGGLLAIVFAIFVRNKPKKPPYPEVNSNLNFRISWSDIGKILLSRQNWLILFYTGLAFSPVAVFASLWGNPFLHSAYHIAIKDVPLYSTVMFAGLAVGGPVLGAISDYLGNRRGVMFTTSTCSLFIMILVVYVNQQPLWALGVELFLSGFVTGGFILGFAIAKENNPITVAATVIAFVNTGDPVVGAWTDPIIGKMLDMHWNHQTFFRGAPLFSPHAYHIGLSVLIFNLVMACVLIFFVCRKNNEVSQAPENALDDAATRSA